MVNKSIEQMVVNDHGEEFWERVKRKAGVDVEVFISHEGYPDQISYALLGALSEIEATPLVEVLERFGVHWVVVTAQEGYPDLMAAAGSNMHEFLINLPDFHSRVSMVMPHLKPPEFACSDVAARSLRLHYMSGRSGLAPFVVGLLKGLGQIYRTPVEVEQVAKKTDGADHDEFLVRW